MARVRGQKTVYQGWLYDTVTVANGFTTTTFFTAQRGQAGKTSADTNLQTPSSFTGVNALKVKSLVLKMEDLIPSDDAKQIQLTVLTFTVNDIPVPDPIPSEFILGGSTLVESVRGASGQQADYVSVAGSGFVTNALTFAEPGLVILDPGDTFRATLDAPGGALQLSDDVRMRLILFGPRSKPTM
jgi:hypothetical protein